MINLLELYGDTVGENLDLNLSSASYKMHEIGQSA